ncbi:MAG: HigA family addiction module antitoxin [Dyadobacter sp.]
MENLQNQKSMKKPSHPGEVLQSLYLEPLLLSVSKVAIGLNVKQDTLQELINGDLDITPDMALRLSEAFNTTPQLWLNLQQNFDLYQEEIKERDFEIQHFWSGFEG